VSIASPDDGATVGSPFTVTMEANGLTVEQAGQVREGAGPLPPHGGRGVRLAGAGDSRGWGASADQVLADGQTCQQTGDARGSLFVAADGRISGTLDAEEIETCSFGFDRTRSGLTLVLEGTASASALTLNHTGNTEVSTTTGYLLLGFFSAPGVLDPVPVPITAPGVAEGSVTREMPNNYTITLTFDFRCVTC
jgi:hypothetical protein